MLEKTIEKIIIKSLKKVKEERVLAFQKIPSFSVNFSLKEEFGDLTTDIAFRISQEEKKNPLKIAKTLKEYILREDKGRIFRGVEVVDPGYINFFVKDKKIWESFQQISGKKRFFKKRKKTIVIDYSSPNIAKPFGIGHLRSTIIGQALCNLYKSWGWRCVGDNHLGDWGTQFGKLIFQIERKKLRGKSKRERKKTLDNLSVEELEKLYVDFHREAEKDPSLEEEGRKWFKKLEEGDKEALYIWKKCVRISLEEFQKIYDLLKVKIDYSFGESFYKDLAKKVVKEALRKKIARKSEGAIIIDFKDDNLPPAILLKSDGTTTYFSRDLATIKFRLKRRNPDLIVYEVGKEQDLYFKQLFLAAEKIGWIKKEKMIHLSHGLIRGAKGKLSTRRGEIIHLEDVLREAIERAEKLIKNEKISEAERKKIAKIVGIGAIKYNDLSQEIKKDIDFKWEKILNLKGESSPYIQYTVCRIKSLLRKSGKRRFIFPKFPTFEISSQERNLMKEIIRFPSLLEKSAKEFSPNLIAKFSLNLAKKYNYFYDNNPILSTTLEKRNFRLYLSFITYKFLEISLGILGIEIPPKM